ncbi:hypothetical protein CVT24_002843, partial [Panaeolus cyanescens]
MRWWGFQVSLLVSFALSLQVFAATLQQYPNPSIYPASGYWTMTVDGVNVPVVAFDGYAYAHFSFGNGAARIRIVATQLTSITDFIASPVKMGYKDKSDTNIWQNAIGFTMDNPHYMIIRIPGGYRELIICADPLEMDAPPSTGSGIFNVVTNFGADPTGTSLSTTSFAQAMSAASSNGGGIVYVPPGVYPVGNIIIPSAVSLYLAGGSVLRFTGNQQDYTTDWLKTSQGRNGTEWITTAHNSADIKIYGRGTIDCNGEYALRTGRFIAHAVVPMATTRFTYDGPLIRHCAAWTLMVTRSNNVIIDHAKVLNALSMGENDAVDIVDSQHVVVRNSIGVAWDDSFSTKAQPQGLGITINYPGTNQPVTDVLFTNNLAYTGCYGFKVGQGVYSTQSNIRFEDGVVYKAAVGLGVHHKQGSSAVTGVQFTRMEIEELTGSNGGHQSWLALFNENGNLGVGPMSDISLWKIAIRDIGSTNSVVNGITGAAISDVRLRDIWLKSLNRYVVSLAEAKVVPNSMASGVVLLSNSSRPYQVPSHVATVGVNFQLPPSLHLHLHNLPIMASSFNAETNSFLISIPSSIYQQYAIEMQSRSNKPLKRREKIQYLQHLQNVVKPDVFRPRLVYDGDAIAYCAGQLNFGGSPSGSFTVSLASTRLVESGRGITIIVSPTGGQPIDPRSVSPFSVHVHDLLSGRRETSRARVAITLIQNIVRQWPNMHHTNNGRAYFPLRDLRDIRDIGYGLQLTRGIFQSVRPSDLKALVLQLDTCTAAVYKHGDLRDISLGYLGSLEGERGGRHARGPANIRQLSTLSEGEFRSLERFLKKVRVTYKIPGGQPKTKIIHGLVRKAGEYTFMKDDREITVAEHYYRAYGYRMQHPTIIGVRFSPKDSERQVIVPLELCEVERGQLYKKKLPDAVTPEVVKFASLRPAEKRDNIKRAINLYSSSEFVQESNIRIEQQPLSVAAKRLPHPPLLYAKNDRVNVDNGAWNVLRRRFYEASEMNHWACINFDPAKVNMQMLRQKITELVQCCGVLGMKVSPQPVWTVEGNPQSPNSIFENINPGPHKDLIIFVILPDNCAQLRQTVKHWGDIRLGADASHPGPGVQKPTTTSLVFSTDMYATKYSALMGIQEPRTELIEDLEDFVLRAVERVGDKVPRPPSRIIFFRDGVSEGEYDQVKEKELAAMDRALQR